MPTSNLSMLIESLYCTSERSQTGNFTPRERALACLEASTQGLAAFDREDRLCYGNSTFLLTFDIPADVPQSWEDILRHGHRRKTGLLLDTDDVEWWVENEKSKRRRSPVRNYAADLIDGRTVWITETLHPDGWLVVFTTDISLFRANELALMHARDEALLAANTDPLTGIFNRRFMLTRLNEAIAGLKTTGRPFSICLLDLDHFKKINDTYGHLAGDQVIQHFAREAQRHLRPTDMLSRIGGEEFLLLLGDTSSESAKQVVERLRHALRTSSPALGASDFAYTFSAGVTEGKKSDSREDVMQRADIALYAAKQAGRNCHIVLSPK